MPAEIACSSSHKNDASIRKCEPWCDSEQSGRHCSWCKCKGCGICRRSQPSPLVLASAAHDRNGVAAKRHTGTCQSGSRSRPLSTQPPLGMGTAGMSATACNKLAAAVHTYLSSGGAAIDTSLTYCGFGGRKHYALEQIARGLEAARVPRHCVWLT